METLLSIIQPETVNYINNTPGPAPEVPVNAHIYLLIAAGVIFGCFKMLQLRKIHHEHEARKRFNKVFAN